MVARTELWQSEWLKVCDVLMLMCRPNTTPTQPDPFAWVAALDPTVLDDTAARPPVRGFIGLLPCEVNEIVRRWQSGNGHRHQINAMLKIRHEIFLDECDEIRFDFMRSTYAAAHHHFTQAPYGVHAFAFNTSCTIGSTADGNENGESQSSNLVTVSSTARRRWHGMTMMVSRAIKALAPSR